MNAANTARLPFTRTERAQIQVRHREIALMVRRIIRRSRGAVTVEEARRVAFAEAIVGLRLDQIQWRRPGWIRYDWHRHPGSVRSYIERQIRASRAAGRLELP